MRRNIVITGGAGFIGSHVVRLFVNKYPEYNIINLDKLTYAGNLSNLKDIEDKPNYKFVKMDICDFEAFYKLMQDEKVDGIIHLAAESHVDRSIKDPFTFARTNVMGTLSLLQAAKLYWESLPEKYDGKIFYSCNSVEEYVEPPLPAHNGLIAQEYNSSNISIIGNLMSNIPRTVGVSYITDDGKTRLYIRIDTDGRMNVPIRFKQNKAKGVAVDWGDGSDVEYFNGTGNVSMTHAYSKIGNYVITLDPSDDCTLSLGSANSSYCVMGPTGNASKVYSNMLIKAEIGRNVLSLDNYAFYGCTNLESVTIPKEVTSIGSYIFRNCFNLCSLSIPSSVNTLGTYTFQECRSLKYVSMPSVTSYSTNLFYQCQSLLRIEFTGNTTV